METLYLQLLGYPQVFSQGIGQGIPNDKPSLLLLYLALESVWLERSKLISLFYPDRKEASARVNLRQILKRAEELPFVKGLEIEYKRVRWLVSNDVNAFQNALDNKDWDKAITLYKGKLFDNLDFSKISSELESIINSKRDELHNAYHKTVFEYTAQLKQKGDLNVAKNILKQFINADPTNERGVQAYIKLCYLEGSRADALKMFRQFEKKLWQEFELEPLESTKQLIQDIRNLKSTPLP